MDNGAAGCLAKEAILLTGFLLSRFLCSQYCRNVSLPL
jgi:hypothetical protein